MKKLLIASLLSTSILLPLQANAETYWLVIGSYRQGPGRKPEVSGITSPTIYAIPMQTLEQCQLAGKKIEREVYRPVWQFDNRWTCILGK